MDLRWQDLRTEAEHFAPDSIMLLLPCALHTVSNQIFTDVHKLQEELSLKCTLPLCTYTLHVHLLQVVQELQNTRE